MKRANGSIYTVFLTYSKCEAYLKRKMSSSALTISSKYRVPTEVNDQLNYVDGKRLKPAKSSKKFKVIAPYNGKEFVFFKCRKMGK